MEVPDYNIWETYMLYIPSQKSASTTTFDESQKHLCRHSMAGILLLFFFRQFTIRELNLMCAIRGIKSYELPIH